MLFATTRAVQQLRTGSEKKERRHHTDANQTDSIKDLAAERESI
jgi:hypothetical protein